MEQVDARKECRLRKRDIEILKYLASYGFASVRWIHEEFWNGQSNRHSYRRLHQLKAVGYIEDLVGDMGKRLGYRLTKKGLAFLGKEKGAEGQNFHYRAAYRTTFDHDHFLIGLGNVLSKIPAIRNYQTEAQVRQQLAQRYGFEERREGGYKVPDALFELDTKKASYRIALELEIAPKGYAYRKRILRQLSKSPDFDVVFFIVADSNLMQLYRDTLTELRAKDPHVKFANRKNGFYFGILAEVLEQKERALFMGDGKALTLAELNQNPAN